MTDLRLQQCHSGGGLCLSILNLAHTNETLAELQELASYSAFSLFATDTVDVTMAWQVVWA